MIKDSIYFLPLHWSNTLRPKSVVLPEMGTEMGTLVQMQLHPIPPK